MLLDILNPLEPLEHEKATSQVLLDLFLAPLPEFFSTSLAAFALSPSRGLNVLPQSTESARGYDWNTPGQHSPGQNETETYSMRLFFSA